MVRVKKIFVLIIFCAFIIAGFGFFRDQQKVAIQDAIVEGELGSGLDEYLTRITPFGFSGALLVAKEGKIILNKGYGWAIRAEAIPNTADTVFSVGSITKQFTAAGIMKLEMQGKLDTNDPISKYLDNVPEDKSGITLHHLLTHTAGVINFTGMDYDVAHRDETVKRILDAPLLFAPGDQFEYSNAGYSLLAAILEKVSGQNYEQFLNGHLFKPAGMQATGYRIPDWDKKVVAHWYVGDTDNGIPLDKPYPYWNLLGNGGILSTTMEMYKWHLALNGETVLSTITKKKLFTPFLNDYAYGWDVLKTERGTLIQHDGASMLGNSAEMRRYIDADVVTILFCNQAYGESALFEAIRDKIEMIVFGGEVKIPPAVTECDTATLRKFEGIFQLPTGGSLRASVENRALVIVPIGQDAINLLLFPEQDKLSANIEFNKQSAVFEAAVKGDYHPFEEALANKNRLPRYRQFIKMRLQRYEKRTGTIQKVLAIGTIPVGYEGPGAVATIIQLKGEKGNIFFHLYWQEGKIVAMSPARSAQLIAIPFMPLSETEFAGYQLGMARNISISFKSDADDFISGLTVHGKKVKIIARKKG